MRRGEVGDVGGMLCGTVGAPPELSRRERARVVGGGKDGMRARARRGLPTDFEGVGIRERGRLAMESSEGEGDRRGWWGQGQRGRNDDRRVRRPDYMVRGVPGVDREERKRVLREARRRAFLEVDEGGAVQTTATNAR